VKKAQLEAFANHRDPGWKIPLYQQILRWVSGLSAAIVSAFLAFVGLRSLVKKVSHIHMGQKSGLGTSFVFANGFCGVTCWMGLHWY